MVSALRKEYYDFERELTPKKRTRKVNVSKMMAKRRQNFFKVVSLIGCFAIAFTIVFRFAVITEANNQIVKQQKALATLQQSNQQAKVQMEYSMDLNQVEDYAKTQLGMKRPEKYQIIRVSLTQSDHALVMGKKQENVDVARNVLGFLSGTLEYLY